MGTSDRTCSLSLIASLCEDRRSSKDNVFSLLSPAGCKDEGYRRTAREKRREKHWAIRICRNTVVNSSLTELHNSHRRMQWLLVETIQELIHI
ncbi:unnamed protein product [Cuscuta campestris]|uniref:Uncharacterized protein n=1 Tax=Cuscuta campestris TaxID=132261 RepID=A0A484NQA0_9ASTE|nr:unnamed protein product [Cuscuta campestris]